MQAADGRFSSPAAACETVARRPEDVATLLDCHIHTGLILTRDLKLILKQPLNFLTLFLCSFEVHCTVQGTARLRGSAPFG